MFYRDNDFYAKKHQCRSYACKGTTLLKRKTKPYTATSDGHFDYYQCPVCKTNYSFNKE